MHLAADLTQVSLLNYGLAGLIVVLFVIPMGLYIIRDKERQIKELQGEIVRQRGEMADLRRVLDPIVPALSEQARVMNLAVVALTARGGGSGVPLA